jgi:hypothetical protein
VNAARLTSGKESSSWRTPTEAETHNQDYSSQTYLQNQVQPNWPTVRASEYKDVGPVGSKSHDHMLGKHYLCAVVTQDAANWPTPEATSSCHGHGGTWSTTQFNLHNAAMGVGILPPQWPIRRPDNKTQTTKERMAKRAVKHGQAAPASSSSLGSRQGLWRTPQANEAGAKVETLFTKDGAPAMPGRRAYRLTPSGTLVLQSQTINQQVEMVQNWATPQAKDHKSGHRDPTIVQYKQLNVEVEARATGKLNPRWVETLMGLPIGWTMPSCTSPQTIALTSCDSLAMELSQPPQSGLSGFSLAS